MRSGTKAIEDDTEKRLAIPITVRQLEAVIRIAESLARMELTPFAVDRHIEEALRLFQVTGKKTHTDGTSLAWSSLVIDEV